MEPWRLNLGNFTGISSILVAPVGPSHLLPTLFCTVLQIPEASPDHEHAATVSSEVLHWNTSMRKPKGATIHSQGQGRRPRCWERCPWCWEAHGCCLRCWRAPHAEEVTEPAGDTGARYHLDAREPNRESDKISAVCSACCSRRILTRTDHFQGQSGQPRKQWHAEMADKIATKRLLTLILSLRAEMNDWNTRLVKARMLLISLLCAEQDLAGGKLTIS